jgi:hypothetical protein
MLTIWLSQPVQKTPGVLGKFCENMKENSGKEAKKHNWYNFLGQMMGNYYA